MITSVQHLLLTSLGILHFTPLPACTHVHLIHHGELLSRSQPQILFWVLPAVSHDQLYLPNRKQRPQQDKSTSIPKVLRLQWYGVYSTLGWFAVWLHFWCTVKRRSSCCCLAHTSATVVTGVPSQMANISWTGNHVTNIMLDTNRKCGVWCETFLIKLGLI